MKLLPFFSKRSNTHTGEVNILFFTFGSATGGIFQLGVVILAPNGAIGQSLWDQFPQNKYLKRLLRLCRQMQVHLDRSEVHGQWLYHPTWRTIYVWEPDLTHESLSFLVVIMAHELGHAMDFDAHPELINQTKQHHWWDMPLDIETTAFVNGFCLLKELEIPISLDQYVEMIDESIATVVRDTIESEHLCCLLSQRPLSISLTCAS